MSCELIEMNYEEWRELGIKESTDEMNAGMLSGGIHLHKGGKKNLASSSNQSEIVESAHTLVN